MATNVRTAEEDQVAELLVTAKKSLGLSLTFLSRMDGEVQHLEIVESAIPFFKDGQTQPQPTSLCQAILDGKLPHVIPNIAKLPEAKRLPAAKFPRIRSFVSVPVTLSDGTIYGTFCAAGFSADKGLTKRDQALMEVLASATATIIEPGVRRRRSEEEILTRLEPIIDQGGPRVVVQPIVELSTGQRVGAEALSRFPPEWGKAPDVVFEEAAKVGLGADLELLALHGAAAHLSNVTGYVAMNVSPSTALDPRCLQLFDDLPIGRILLELSEHDQVEDYDVLEAALAPLRARGLRLAIDDVGAGFSSLRHIVLTKPDVIKLDRTIVDGISTDPMLATLCRSLVEFAHGSNATVVAEGIETVEDARALKAVGVDYGQGWFLGRPGAPDDMVGFHQIDADEAQEVPREPSVLSPR